MLELSSARDYVAADFLRFLIQAPDVCDMEFSAMYCLDNGQI